MKSQVSHRSILKLAVPAFLSQASFTITGMIDLIMVGTISPAAIAAVGMGGTIYWNLIVLIGGPAIAMVYLCSQSYGAGNMERFSERALAGLMLCGLSGLIFACFPFSLSRIFYHALGAEEAVITEGVRYFSFRLIGFPLHLLYTGLESAIKSTGDTKRPMVLKFIGHICNVSCNYVLIFGRLGFSPMGVRGAGIASLCADVLTFALFTGAFLLTLKRERIPFSMRLKLTPALLLIREGFKVSVQQFASSFSILVYTSVIARLGAVSLAANQIAVSVISMSFLPAFGLGQASEILIGHAVGRGSTQKARMYGLTVELYCIAVMVVFGLVIGLFPQFIGGLYTRDQQVLSLLRPMLLVSAFLQIFDGIQIVFAASLRAVGDTTYLLVITVIGSWLIFIPTVLLAVFILQEGVVLAWGIRYLLMVFLSIMYFQRFVRKDWTTVRAR